MWFVQEISFRPLTSLVSLLKRLWKVCLCHGTVTTKAWQKCMGMISCFGCRNEFSSQGMFFLLRNGLIEHIECKAGAMVLSFIQCSHSHKILIFLSYYIHCYVFQLGSFTNIIYFPLQLSLNYEHSLTLVLYCPCLYCHSLLWYHVVCLCERESV